MQAGSDYRTSLAFRSQRLVQFSDEVDINVHERNTGQKPFKFNVFEV